MVISVGLAREMGCFRARCRRGRDGGEDGVAVMEQERREKQWAELPGRILRFALDDRGKGVGVWAVRG